MQITINDLKYIISESVKRIICEKHSSMLFHYCSINSLVKMLESNTLYLSNDEQEFNGEGLNYMSLTRNKNSQQGYPYMQSYYSLGGGTHHNLGSEYIFCRINLNGNALKNHNNIKVNNKQHSFKIKPFDYLYHQGKRFWDEGGYDIVNGKHEMMTSNDEEEVYHQPFSQAEDRLTSSSEIIPNMLKYVDNIDICINEEHLFKNIDMFETGYLREQTLKELKTISSLKKQYPDLIRLYNKQSNFDLGNNQTIMLSYIKKYYNIIKQNKQ